MGTVERDVMDLNYLDIIFIGGDEDHEFYKSSSSRTSYRRPFAWGDQITCVSDCTTVPPKASRVEASPLSRMPLLRSVL